MTHNIYNIDCLEWMKTQPDNSIDCIITSPPYNKLGLREGQKTSTAVWGGANIEYNTYHDEMPEADYQQWQINVINECIRLLKPTGSLFYQHKIRNWKRVGYHPYNWIGKSSATFYQEIIWHRKSTTAFDEHYFYTTTERVYWLCKGKPSVYKDQVEAKYKNDVWEIPPARNNDHPAPFPQQLVKNCLLMTTKENDVVYDPFMGSGTTIKVAEVFGRNSIETEIDKHYVDSFETTTYTELFE